MSGGEALCGWAFRAAGTVRLIGDIEASISGGIVVAAGQSGMAQNFGEGFNTGAILVNTSRAERGWK